MQSYFKDEVHIALLSSNEHELATSGLRPGPSSETTCNDNPSPQLSCRASLSSTTIFDYEDPYHVQDVAFARDRHGRRVRSDSAETLVGNFISNRFPSLKNSFPTILGTPKYKILASDELRKRTRKAASKKKAICLFLLAAVLLGIGGRQIRKAPLRSSHNGTSESFELSLHDGDSLQDSKITVPTIPRPPHPKLAEEILPFDLHKGDTVNPATPAPSHSASNRRQLDSIPAQRHIFDKQSCVDAWVAHGTICDDLAGIYRKRPDLTHVELLYTWVNGSDWRHMAAKWMHGYRPTGHWQEYVEEDLFPSSSTSAHKSSQPEFASRRRSMLTSRREQEPRLLRRAGAAIQNRFRDHEELRFSMRSAAKHLHGLSTIHVVAPDFSAPYHIQPGAKNPTAPGKLRNAWSKVTSKLRRRSDRWPFMLNVDRLNENFLGLPSQLRRVQGLGTDRFTTDEGQIREGQVPQWLSVSNTTHVLAGQEAATTGANWGPTEFAESLSKLFFSSSPTVSDGAPPKIRLHHDWNAFTDNWLVTEPATAEARKDRNNYRRAALPTFNSMAVEAMLGDQPGLSDSFIYSNDDFFFMDDATTGDFTSPLFGPVMRLDYNLVVTSKKAPDTTAGEWPALFYTNFLLDQRFGKRSRPYIQHVHKSFSKSLLQETRLAWAYDHARLGINRFRNSGDNIVTHFLTYYNIVERHREALLWSFFMLKLDHDGDGLVSNGELPSALAYMGLTQDQIATANLARPNRTLTVSVKLPRRRTLAGDSANAALVKTGWPVPLKSRYVFSSQDGFPLGDISRQVISRRDEDPELKRERMLQRRNSVYGATLLSHSRGDGSYYGWPDFVDDPSLHPTNEWHNRRFERSACELDVDRCLLTPFAGLLEGGKVEWEQVFKHLSYTDVNCGDCLIHHLVGQSGSRGLSAFLPSAEQVYKGPTQDRAKHTNPVPHLPLTSVWNPSSLEIDSTYESETACFTVSCVLANSGYGQNTPLRTFASQLIQRYAYTISETPLEFRRLETQYNAVKTMNNLEQSSQRPSALQNFHQQHRQKGSQVEAEKEEAGAWLESQTKVDVDRAVLVCINDDLTDRWVEYVGKEFTQWLGKMWPSKQVWEL
ncbi:uncharacterized protein MEPE_00770 [Melanopsichium pennsylvanicum]|uniref:Stealth protein CR3 conserved region 3 domain-containing protein n=2 Tax=Melanopsichium pennsylvanicum TaxID=63383 RepID=A0AAJ5C333_9BASI|nr:conserved hypothetical protein [Melanopsichium pennsylvanicum 4]SNX82064.1 uncharacterized protein MEPE_00770 [Melanopsichium pennsylvanicum]